MATTSSRRRSRSTAAVVLSSSSSSSSSSSWRRANVWTVLLMWITVSITNSNSNRNNKTKIYIHCCCTFAFSVQSSPSRPTARSVITPMRRRLRFAGPADRRHAKFLSLLSNHDRRDDTDEDHSTRSNDNTLTDTTPKAITSSTASSTTAEQIQKRLVQKGLSWHQPSSACMLDLNNNNNNNYSNKMRRVPGCVATLYVRAIVVDVRHDDDDTFTEGKNNDDTDSTTTFVLSLQGYSDAIFGRGLLSTLRDFLEGTSSSSLVDSLSLVESSGSLVSNGMNGHQRRDAVISRIVQLDPESMADRLGVRPALSKGRNDGLANMMRIVQNQLQEYQMAPPSSSSSSSSLSMSQPERVVERQPPSLPTPASTEDDDGDDNSTQQQQQQQQQPTVALLLSGGVDSSVALRLLQQQGYRVTPFYLKIWLEDELAHLGVCPWEVDVATCRQVCEQAGVDLRIISLQDEYHDRVMKHTLREASVGRTPNPDILCNSRVKFGCFLEYLQSQRGRDDKGETWNFDYIASGHYAQLKRDDADGGVARLFRAPDPVKDQSYFLCALDQSQLGRLLFPIGHLEKTKVRQLAEEFQLPNRQRPDSQGLCFLGKVKFRDFLSIHLGESPGVIVDAFTGEKIGEHKGVWYHTVGQRKGLGPFLLPTANAFGPWYVVAKDPAKNIVFASNQYDEDAFLQARSEFHVENVHWIAGSPPPLEGFYGATNRQAYRLTMKIRHGPKLVGGTLTMANDGENNNSSASDGTIHLDQKDGGLAPGQYVVFYNDDAECLGGGVISERHWAKFLLDASSRQLQGISQGVTIQQQ